ncbi:MAG: hypothetical protein IJ315_04640 [Firmicutes bacterium]|nr:hypothetical protein [Bacillota bacterium]
MNTAKVQVFPDKKTVNVSPNMYGIFYEDINHAGDGGLYAELVRNRSFMDACIPVGTWYYNGQIRTLQRWTHPFDINDPLPGWRIRLDGEDTLGTIRPDFTNPRNPKVPNYMHVVAQNNDCHPVTIINDGFWGMAVEPGTYHLRLIARSENIPFIGISLVTSSGYPLSFASIDGIHRNGYHWAEYTADLTVSSSASDCHLELTLYDPGELDLDYVSLMPDNAVEGIFNPHLYQMLKDLKPAFVRFPGGCIVEGMCLDNAWDFEPTLGAPEDRPGCWNLWNYRRTDGLGYHEFMLLCEKLGADAMYVVNCGMSCQNRNSQTSTPEQTDMFLQRAINAIEYAIAPVDTEWGAKRAAAGHPQPFPLKYLEIGNENYGPAYVERYHYFYTELKKRFPQLKYLATDRTGHDPAEIDIMDDQYYMAPEFFASMFTRYDNAPRDQYKIYVGEYACKTDVGIGNAVSAISDAIFLMGCENNGDVVEMTSYAPLLCHNKDRRWSVNLICFQDGKYFGIPTYHILKLFAQYRPNFMVESASQTDSFTGEAHVFCNAGFQDDKLIVKIVNFSQTTSVTTLDLGGYHVVQHFGLFHPDERAENSIEQPENVCIKENTDYTWLPPYSFTLLVCEKDA